jgi:hypothetical protein
MTTWYLIIILFGPGSSDVGSSQQTIEFVHQEQCETVRDEIREKIKQSWLSSYIECRSYR